VEPHKREETLALLHGLPVVPTKRIEYRGRTFEEMDTEAVIARRPQVALVDELAHTNVPGSNNEKRWRDVHELLDQGITVISTVNIQHLESVADVVESITGAPVKERIPDWVVDGADELEMVDMSPHALQQRIRHGNVYPSERAEQALRNFFREGNLNALRELALRKVATKVEDDLEEYMNEHDIHATWPASDRVIVYVDESPNSQRVVRRAWQMADGLQAELLAVFVETPQWGNAEPEAKRALEENLRFSEDLGAEVVRAQASDIASGLLQIAGEKNAGSIVVARPREGRIRSLIGESTVDKLLRLAKGVDIHVVSERR
jgi:two-component system sensor histidine kinase KdpD